MEPRYEDLTGREFGRLTAIEKVGNGKGGCAIWKCKCQCGNEVSVLSQSLKSGHTASCGCKRRERMESFRGETALCKSKKN